MVAGDRAALHAEDTGVGGQRDTCLDGGIEDDPALGDIDVVLIGRPAPVRIGRGDRQLYTQLALGEPRVAAFRLAQHRTRTRHPNYRDWGAFTYYGC